MELHRNSLGDDYIPQISSSKMTRRSASPMLDASQSYGRSHNSHDPSVDKGINAQYFLLLMIFLEIRLFRTILPQNNLDHFETLATLCIVIFVSLSNSIHNNK